MSERPGIDPNFLPDPLNQEVSRRSLLFASGALVAAAATPDTVRSLAEASGRFYDTIASPEDIVTEPIVTLAPRQDNTPAVEPKPRSGFTAVQTGYKRRGKGAVLRLAANTPLYAEHTNTALGDDEYSSAGTAIITTAEGLTDGQQAYCKLFKGKTRTIAVGYEGDLFVYDTILNQGKNKTSGEWVRLLAREEGDALPSHALTTTPWEILQATAPRAMLIEEVVAGTKTLHDLGYQPFGAVLPTTKMPDCRSYTFTPADCAQNVQQLMEGKSFFITKNGEAIDINHLRAKAGETLSLFTQLQYQQVAGETAPIASVNYSAGSPALYEFAVQPESLHPDTLPDTTFAIMNAVTMLMEGVSQRYVNEKIPVVGKWSRDSGMGHEDMFTNSLGITGMLSLIHEYKLADRLREPLEAIHQRNRHLSAKDAQTAINQAIEDVRSSLVDLVVARTAATYGLRPLKEPLTVELPRGIYPLIPVKLSHKDAATPTNIDLQAAGITANNPQVHYKPIKVPAMQTTVGHLLSRAGL